MKLFYINPRKGSESVQPVRVTTSWKRLLLSLASFFLFFGAGVSSVHALVTNPWPDSAYQYRRFYSLPTDPIGNHVPTNYRLFVPVGYNASNGQKYPVVIFLHGKGQNDAAYSETDLHVGNTAQMTNNGQYPFVTTANQAIFPCFFILPQCVSDSGPALRHQTLVDLVASLATEFNIDLDRVILTGLSLGGGGTLYDADLHPDKYAAAVPLSPTYAAPGYTGNGLAQMATWFFHAADDSNGPTGVGVSDNLVNGLRTLGGRPIYTRFATGDHSALTWASAYECPALIPWLAAQRRGVMPVNIPATITITSPAAGPNYTTSNPSLTLAGTTTQASGVSNPVLTRIEWCRGDWDFQWNHSLASGTVSNWQTTSVALNNGLNSFKIVAIGSSYSSLQGGTYYSATLNATYTPGGDIQKPVLGTVSPATGTTVSTSSVTLSGSATDNVNLQSVSCKNTTTTNTVTVNISGTSANWNAAVPLVNGANNIEVTCTDAAGNVSTPVVTRTITYTPSTPTPSVTVTTPSADTTSASTPFTFSGSATDSGGLQSVSCKNTTTNYTVTVNLSGTSANWNATVPLTSGANVIQVTATNTANVVSSIVTRTVTYTPPSSGWTGTAVGTATGSFQQTSSDSFSVSGTGTVFEGTQNQHYYVYQNATGDCSITARITSMGTADGNAKVGVMIRENASAESSAYVFCGLTPNYGAIAFGHGNAATYNVGGSTVTAAPPYWVRVSRSGSTITTSISSDGVTWNALGGTYAAPWVSMGNPVTVGLAVHSHNGATNTATFTNVSTTGTPSPWTGSTIGTATGSFQQTGAAAFTVAGSGTNMSGNDVQHYYVSMPATDDCSISARVTLPAGLNSAAKAGVMIRESNDPSAAYVFCALTPAYGSVAFGHGTGTGYNVGGSTLAVATTYWVKVSRTGGTITTSLSSDGVTWNALGGTYAAPWVSMGSSVTVGLAVHGAGSSASITFDNVVMAP